eukprot:TRINITY_DN17723_c0_g1_i1.p1 TRINITY_DN17723_c0_g1~~TRINITY_DN17723_c0_g1_i1.p1  ORF type:complete len:302 (+),score=33.54 TRINITY_DN17723_c0_g1_i1:72-977(+)
MIQLLQNKFVVGFFVVWGIQTLTFLMGNATTAKLVDELDEKNTHYQSLQVQAVQRPEGCVWNEPLTRIKKGGAGKLTFDVGGNRGVFTQNHLLAYHTNKVWIFEPYPENVESLRITFMNEPRVKIEPVAVSEKPGSLEFFISHVCHANPSLANQSWWDPDNRCQWQKVSVESRTLDSYHVKEEVYLLKVDVQGYEYGVFKGAENLLKKNQVRYIYSEFWPVGMEKAGYSARETLSLLAHYGFECWNSPTDIFNGDLGRNFQIVDVDWFLDLFPKTKASQFAPSDAHGSWTDIFCVNKKLHL